MIKGGIFILAGYTTLDGKCGNQPKLKGLLCSDQIGGFIIQLSQCIDNTKQNQ